METDVIHLKHHFDKTAAWFVKMSPDNRASYSRQSEHSTACWMNDAGQSLTMTDNPKLVTCRKCIRAWTKLPSGKPFESQLYEFDASKLMLPCTAQSGTDKSITSVERDNSCRLVRCLSCKGLKPCKVYEANHSQTDKVWFRNCSNWS